MCTSRFCENLFRSLIQTFYFRPEKRRSTNNLMVPCTSTALPTHPCQTARHCCQMRFRRAAAVEPVQVSIRYWIPMRIISAGLPVTSRRRDLLVNNMDKFRPRPLRPQFLMHPVLGQVMVRTFAIWRNILDSLRRGAEVTCQNGRSTLTPPPVFHH